MRISFMAQVAVCLALLTIMPSHLKAAAYNDNQNRTPVNMAPSPIDDLRLPTEWPFISSNQMLDYNRKELSIRLKDALFLSKGQSAQCERIGANTKSISGLASCLETAGLAFLESGRMSHLVSTFINLAKNNPLNYKNDPNDFSDARYQARSVLTVYGAFYAFYYEQFEFTEADRKLVDQYFETQLLYLNMDDVGQRNEQVFCDPRDHANIGIHKKGRADINTCESNRWKATIAQLLLGIRFQNETLFRRGIYNTRFMLLAFDKEGIFVPWATRGALAIHYSNEIPRFLGKLTEIFHALGYDFLAHRLENGLEVNQLFDLYFKVFDDKSILDKYAKRQHAQKGENYDEYLARSTADELNKWGLTKSAFVTIKSKHTEISSAAEFIELTPNRTSIRWFVGQQAEPSFARLQAKSNEAGRKCGYLHRRMWGNDWNMLPFLVQTDNEYDLDYQLCFHDYLINTLDEEQVKIYQMIFRSVQQVANGLTNDAPTYADIYEKTANGWRLKNGQASVKLDFLNRKEPDTERRGQIARGFLRVTIDGKIIEEGVAFFELKSNDGNSVEQAMVWGIWDDAIPPLNQFNAINKAIEETCEVHFSMPNDLLVFVIQTNNEDTVERQSCFLQEYINQPNSEVADIYLKLLGAAPKLFERAVK